MRGRESAAPAFLPSGKGHGGAAPVSRNGPRRFCRLSSPIRHYFPDCWAVNWSAADAAHGNCTPSEDLSELHRLLVSVAMQKYHCRQMRSWRGSLPRLLLDERVSLGTFRSGTCIDTGNSRAGGHGAFSASLSSFLRRLIC